jgi:hypothetical protein
MRAVRLPATLFDITHPDAESAPGTLFETGQSGCSPAGAPAREPERRPDPRPDTTGGERGLDDLVAGLWEGLAAHRVVECPVCGAAMHPEYGAHALPVGGRCRACASTLT